MMNQGWRDLTFLHWAVPPEEVAHLMPPGVRPDTLDGVTYVGLIPFRMVRAGIARGPGVPWFGSFLETNVRLYSVDDTGRRGIVFLSLDAERAAVVLGARAVFGLPYRWSRMRYRASGDVHSYDTRLRRQGRPVESHVVVRAGTRRRRTELDGSEIGDDLCAPIAVPGRLSIPGEDIALDVGDPDLRDRVSGV